MKVAMGVFNIPSENDSNQPCGLIPPQKSKKKNQAAGDRNLVLGMMTPNRVSVHANKRDKYSMCCSPNNALIHFEKKSPMVGFWSAAVDSESKPPRVLIQLNWYYQKSV